MTKNTSISLGDHFVRFIDAEVEQGRYGSASEVVRAALHLLEERAMKLEALRAALIVGEQSGSATEFDFDEFLAAKRSVKPKVRRRAAAR